MSARSNKQNVSPRIKRYQMKHREDSYTNGSTEIKMFWGLSLFTFIQTCNLQLFLKFSLI
jgi:hypothetical protein